MHFFEQKYKLLTETKQNRKWKISHSFRERPLVSQPIEESQIKKKKKTVMSYSSRKKKKTFFYSLFPLKTVFLRFVFYLNV